MVLGLVIKMDLKLGFKKEYLKVLEMDALTASEMT